MIASILICSLFALAPPPLSEAERAQLEAGIGPAETMQDAAFESLLTNAQRWPADEVALTSELTALDPAQAARLARRVAERIAELKRERRTGRYALLARKAALAQRVEAAAASEGAVDEPVAQAREAWNALPALDGEAERALKARFEAAPAATSDFLAEGLKLKAELLLDLELALDLPSPPAHADARRMRQLARLKERFSSGASDESPEQRVVRWYALAAPEDAEQDARMAVVVRALCAAAS